MMATEYGNALMFNPTISRDSQGMVPISRGYTAQDLAGLPLGLQSSVIQGGDDAFKRLLAQIGQTGAMQGSGGLDESGSPVGGMFYLDPTNLGGYSFDFAHNGGFGNSGVLSATGPDGKRYSVDQQDTPMSQSALEAAALAAAGFGGAGLMFGVGPAAGMFGAGAGAASGGGSLASGVGAGELTAGLSQYAASGLPASVMAPTIPGLGAGMAGTAAAAGSAAGSAGGLMGPPVAGAGGGGFGASQIGQAVNGFLAPVGGLQGLGQIANVASPLIGGWLQNNSANEALQAQMAANNESNALLKRAWEPALAARDSALSKINGLLSNPQSITQDPGYQFGLNQGVNALDRSAASRGMRLSGQQVKAQTQFGQDYAGGKLNESVNRLLQVANVGNMGTGSLNQQAGNTVNIGDAAAASNIAGGNAWGNALNQLTAYGNKNNWWQG